MTSSPAMESFEEARRRHLIQATIETLGDVGFRAASLSEIARRAKVSTGLFAHYFGDKDGLLEATLRFMAGSLTRETARRLRAATTRRERLFAVSDAALSDDQFESRTSAVWLAFWGQLTHSERYKRVQRIYQRRMTSNLKRGLRGLVAPDCVAAYAAMIAAMIDGLWLRSHIGDGAVGSDGTSARALVRSFIDGLLAGTASDETSAGPVQALPIMMPEVSPEPLRHVSPATGEEIARFTPARETEIRRGMQDARRGFAEWSATSAPDRAQILRRCAAALRREGAALAHLETLETGRPLRRTGGGDLHRAIDLLEDAARLAAGQAASRLELAGGGERRTRHRPAGVVAVHCSWSRCLLDLCRLSAALARGNAVIACVDWQASATALRLVALFRDAGLPEGVLVVLRGDAQTLRRLDRQDALLGKDGFHLAGSQDGEAGPPVWATRPKGATLVLAGADPERTAAALLRGRGGWLGSNFLSENVVYVQETIRADLAACLADLANRARVGPPHDDGTEFGPLVSEAHRQWVSNLMAADLRAGARLMTAENPRIAGAGTAAFLAPTVLDACDETSALVSTSTFSPVCTLIPFAQTANLAERLGQRISAPAIGLFAGDVDGAIAVAEHLDRPLALINDYGNAPETPGWADADPYGACRGSAYSSPRTIVCDRLGGSRGAP